MPFLSSLLPGSMTLLRMYKAVECFLYLPVRFRHIETSERIDGQEWMDILLSMS
jgi:hypothetical protein